MVNKKGGEVVVDTDAFGVVCIGYVEVLGDKILATVETKHGDPINLDAVMLLDYNHDTQLLEWKLADEYFQRKLDQALLRENSQVIDIRNVLSRRN